MILRITDASYLNKFTGGNVSVMVCGKRVTAPAKLSGQGSFSIPQEIRREGQGPKADLQVIKKAAIEAKPDHSS